GGRSTVWPSGPVPSRAISSPVNPSATTGVCTTSAVPMATVPTLQVSSLPSSEREDTGSTFSVKQRSGTSSKNALSTVNVAVTLSTGSLLGGSSASLTLTRHSATTGLPRATVSGELTHDPVISYTGVDAGCTGGSSSSADVGRAWSCAGAWSGSSGAAGCSVGCSGTASGAGSGNGSVSTKSSAAGSSVAGSSGADSDAVTSSSLESGAVLAAPASCGPIIVVASIRLTTAATGRRL